MLRNRVVLLSMLALLAVLAACRGEPATPSGNASVAAADRPAPTPTGPPATLPATATRIPSTPPGPSPGSAPTESVGTFPVATSSVPVSVKVAEPTEIPTPTVEPSPTSPPDTTEEDIATILRIIDEYWEAFNDYDVDRAVTMLEEGYRADEEDPIRKDIGRMKLFRVKLGISEETPLTLNETGHYETYLTVKTPVDERRLLMVFRKLDGQWWIVFSGIVD